MNRKSILTRGFSLRIKYSKKILNKLAISYYYRLDLKRPEKILWAPLENG